MVCRTRFPSALVLPPVKCNRVDGEKSWWTLSRLDHISMHASPEINGDETLLLCVPDWVKTVHLEGSGHEDVDLLKIPHINL